MPVSEFRRKQKNRTVIVDSIITGSVESGTLDWIKSEIDQTLIAARQAINDFSTQPDDVTPLRIYANHIHQVVGTLQMVELDGAAMLAHEAELLADSMLDGDLYGDKERNVHGAISLLETSLPEISSYLEKLQQGLADTPVHNLGKINELREMRGAAPVEIFSIFNPNLGVYPTRPGQQENVDEALYRNKISRIRRQFQNSLLGWLRDSDTEALYTITGLTRELQGMSRFNSVSQLWWVASAYMEMMALDPVQQNISQRRIPARLDQLLRKLIEGGEAALVKERDEDLIIEMLYAVGVSSCSSTLLVEIRDAFSLDEMLQKFDSYAGDPKQLSVASSKGDEVERLLPKVASEIYVNLDAAEIALESFAGQAEQIHTLQDIPYKLSQVQGALQMLGQDKAADMLSTTADYIGKLGRNEFGSSPMLIDSLAVAIGTAQTFVEGLEHDRPHVHEMVDRAVQGLEDVLTESELVDFDAADTVSALREHLDNWLGDNANYPAFRQLRQRLREVSAVAGVRNLTKPRRMAQEMNNLLDIVTEDPSFLSPEIENTLRRSLTALDELIGEMGEFVPDVDIPINGEVTAQKEYDREISLNQWQAGAKLLSISEESEQSSEVSLETTLDDTVARIFTQETLGHLGTIRNFLSTKSNAVSPELLRAAHTLRGTSRSLHLVEMSNVFHALDEHLGEINSKGMALGDEEMRILDKAAILSAQVLDRLNTDRTFPAALREEFDKLHDSVARCRKTTESGSLLGDIQAIEQVDVPDDMASGSMPAWPAAPVAPGLPAGRINSADEEGNDGLRGVFIDESTDILARINGSLDRWRDGQEQESSIANVKRELHTLKGGAYAAGFEVMGDLSHQTETLLEWQNKGTPMPSDELRALLEEAHDTLSGMIAMIGRGAPLVEPGHLQNRLIELINAGPDENTVDGRRGIGSAHAVEQVGRTYESGRNVLRMNSEVLDKLINYAGELSITRAQMQEHLSGLRSNFGDLRNNVERFTGQLRQLDIQADSQIRSRPNEPLRDLNANDSGGSEFDPLQMDRYTGLQQISRGLFESLDDLITIQSDISRFIHHSESALQQQAQISFELQDGLMSTHLVPFSTLFPRLRHQARQTARELGKEVELQMKGGEVEIDRKVLDGISEALDHMIRNALDHGIEDPAQREDLGKPGSGAILIECTQKGNNAVIRFGDDGAGLEIEQIRDKAITLGLMKEDASISDQDLIQLIVLPGFTTATKITQLSGRGVGMDVVHNAVRRLGGSIAVDSRPGEGTVFEINLPLSLSITQAISVRCGRQEFAISLNVIQNVMKVDAGELNFPSVGGRTQFEKDGRVYPLIDLPRRFGLASGDGDKQRVAILIIRMGAREVAVKVDELLTTQEVVVKSLGRHISRMEGISGATIRGDGSVVIILDLAALWVADERHGVTDAAAQEQTQRSPMVMVVDDSLTVRKVTARNLSRHGMEVVMAKDGIDAIERMGKRLPDLMLVDIEMPRMDGYQLTEHVRNDPVKKGIPIVIITSRAGIGHKEKAMALGANGYLTKPYQEEELIANVKDCLQSFPPQCSDA